MNKIPLPKLMRGKALTVGLAIIAALSAAPLSISSQPREEAAEVSTAQPGAETMVEKAQEPAGEAGDTEPEPTALPTRARFIGYGIFLIAFLLAIRAIRLMLGRLEEERELGL